MVFRPLEGFFRAFRIKSLLLGKKKSIRHVTKSYPHDVLGQKGDYSVNITTATLRLNVNYNTILQRCIRPKWFLTKLKKQYILEAF